MGKLQWHRSLVLICVIFMGGCDQIIDFPFYNGFVAKNVCSGVFVSGIQEDIMRDEYAGPNVYPLPLFWQVNVDYNNKAVTASDIIFQSSAEQQAYYRPGFGCTLLQDKTIAELNAQVPEPREPYIPPSNAYWPRGTAGVWPFPIAGVDYGAINQALDTAFAPSPDYLKQTVAVVVAHDNRLIAEKYADTVNATTRLLGWSMTKSFTATFIGMLHDRGLLNIKSKAPISEWAGTEKENITIENLLHMASGIEFQESYTSPNNDLSYMLHALNRFSDFIIDRPLIAEPGSTYNYSTADTMMLARIGHEALGGTIGNTHNFLFENLFEPIGISDAVLEYDTAGYPGGGSYLTMKPRDWARLGLLYLNDGNWFGEQVLSTQWVDYSKSPSSANNKYGAQIWTNTNQERWESLPEDTFAFLGHQLQATFIVPSENLVVVRMGFTHGGDAGIEQLVASIIDALPE